MKLVINGDRICALVGDDFPTHDVLVDVPAGFDIDQAHRHRYDAASGQIMPRVPASVTMRQARRVLLAHGLLGAVQPAIDALPEPDRARAQIDWDTGRDVERDSPMIALLAPALGLDEAEIDALFVEADTL